MRSGIPSSRRPRERDGPAVDIAGLRERLRCDDEGENIWSIEQKRGGLIDVEFVARYLQLLHGSRTAELPAGEAVAVFEAERRYELIDPGTAPELANATTLWRDLHHILCLTVADDFIERTAQPALKSVIERARRG